MTDDASRWRRAGTLCASGAGSIGLVALAGWLTGVHGLAEAIPGVSAMKANTAVAIMVGAGALRFTRARGPLALAAATIGALTLLEYAIGGIGIDQALIADHGAGAGRPAPHTAVALLAIGLAIAAGPRPRLRAGALSVALLAVLLGAVGYAYRVHPLTGGDGGIGMGPNTLAALVFLIAGVMVAGPAAWPLSHLRGRGPTATMSRRLTAAIAIVPLAGLASLELQRHGLWGGGVGLALFVVFIVGVLKGVVAITARSLDRLEVADRRFQDLLAAAPDAILVATREGEIVVANDEALRMFGYERAELLGQDVGDVLSGPWTGAGAGGELFARRRDGLEIPVEVSLGPFDTADGSLITAVIRDITERRVGDERLRAAAQFFEISHDLLCTYDSTGYFVELNGAWEQTLGWTARELSARPFTDFVHPDDRARTQAEHRRTTAGRETDRFLNRYRTADGGWRWLEWTSVTPPGEGLSYASARDVTEHVEAQRELAQARDQALAAARAKSAFLANMSHEIRTPLNGVLGITDLLLDGELSPEQREHAQLIRRSGDTLLTVVNDILDVSKIEAGALHLEEAPFSLVEAVEDAFDLTAEPAARKGLELTLALGRGLPATVLGDAVRLRQVLGNLLSNAVKFTAAGEIRVALAAAADAGGRAVVRFEVADQGVGIEPEQLARMFEPFTQADVSTTRRFGGSGLGLTIVSQLVQMMGGAVGATSTPGAGSSFWFTIPFERVPVDVTAPRLDSLAGLLLLVVDDNETNRRLMVSTARSWGMRVTAVASGAEGLEALREAARRSDPFDCAALDMLMPEMDGLELARAIRADAAIPTPALLVLTSSSGERRAAHEAGIDVYMTKPVRRKRLRDALLDAPGVHRRRGEAASAPRPAVRATGARVLVVEDNEINRTVAIELIERRGCTVGVAHNGLEALAALGRERFDLVLMDCQMPELDGYEATRRLRALGGAVARTPVVAMTAHALHGDRARCLDAGMDDYLAKPVRAEDLDRVLARFAPRATTLVDDAAAADLRSRVADPAVRAELVDLFTVQAGEVVATLRAGLDAGDARALAAAAHKLKGTCLTLAAAPLGELCARLDVQARTGALEGAGALVDEIAAACGPTEAALRAALASD